MTIQSASDLYRTADAFLKNSTGRDVGFHLLLTPQVWELPPEVLAGFVKRYHLIRDFQERVQNLFDASLVGEADPLIAELLINETPSYWGVDYHKSLTPRQKRLPVFFRTDEASTGQVLEIQCPGSLWGEYELIHDVLSEARLLHASSDQSLSQRFSNQLCRYLPSEPVVHHLIDNSSSPVGMEYFIQKTRPSLKYLWHDPGIRPEDCNFIRCHDFFGLMTENYVKTRLARCDEGALFYDLPPTVIYDQKIILVLPFLPLTMKYFTDEIRGLFPYTQLLTPEGVLLEDGSHCSIDECSKLPRNQRRYFLKYAGSDWTINWGSHAVYSLDKLSARACRERLENALSGFNAHRYWVLQAAVYGYGSTEFVGEDGVMPSGDGHVKYSAFYGPYGLMGILGMWRKFYKVHGQDDTVAGIIQTPD